MKNGNRKHLDPWGRRRHPYRYDPDTLHRMLVDDATHNRVFGGPGEWGAAFLIGACEKIAGHRRTTVEDYFKALLAECASLTGRESVPLA